MPPACTTVDIVDELFLDELLAIVNRIEHFTDGQRRSGVLPNQAKAFLQFRGSWILQPEQMKRLPLFARALPRWESADDARRAANARRPKLLAQPRKKLRHKIQVLLR